MATETTSENPDETGKTETDKASDDKSTTSKDAGAGDDELTAENAAKWREMARKHERQNGKLQAELDRIKAESMTETEKAIEKAKAKAREEARAEVLAEMIALAVETAAGEKLADPAYARLLSDDVREGFVTKDGKVDRKAIAAALDDLVKRHPNLAKSPKAGALPGGGKKPAQGFSMNDEIRRLAGRR